MPAVVMCEFAMWRPVEEAFVHGNVTGFDRVIMGAQGPAANAVRINEVAAALIRVGDLAEYARVGDHLSVDRRRSV